MAKQKSRAKRWAEAAAKMQAGLDAARAALAEQGFADGLAEIEELKSEYEDWQSNLPENLANSPLGEKLTAVVDLDIDFDSEIEAALDDAESKIGEIEGADLPLGFGRD